MTTFEWAFFGSVLFIVFVLFGAIFMRHSASLAALITRAELAEDRLKRLEDWRNNVRQGANL